MMASPILSNPGRSSANVFGRLRPRGGTRCGFFPRRAAARTYSLVAWLIVSSVSCRKSWSPQAIRVSMSFITTDFWYAVRRRRATRCGWKGCACASSHWATADGSPPWMACSTCSRRSGAAVRNGRSCQKRSGAGSEVAPRVGVEDVMEPAAGLPQTAGSG